MKVSKLF